MTKIGISTYTYTWAIGVPGFQLPIKPLTAIDIIHKAVELDVDVVQISDNIPLHELDQSELKNLSETAIRNCIEIEVGTRGVAPEHLGRYLDIAKQLNSKILRTLLHSGDSTPCMEQAAEWISNIIPEYEKAGIVIAIENHDKHKCQDIVKLIEKVRSPCLGVCLDTVNSFGALECPQEVMKLLFPYTVNIHFKDFTISRVLHHMGFLIEGCPAGNGLLDVDMLMEMIYRSGIDPNVILELWTPFTGTLQNTINKEKEWAIRSIDYLKEKFKKGYTVKDK